MCINLPRHPAWGRAQETYSEDPLLLGEFGAALVRGVQRNAMAVAKHYALNSMENARFTVDVTADAATLHEVFLPHFRRVLEEGVAGSMTSYNSVNGEWAGQNAELMEGILRGEWGFEGVTVSDFIWGLRDAATSLHAGLDVEEPLRQQRAEHLPGDLEAGRADWADVDRAARRILSTQLRFAASVDESEPEPGVVFGDEHRALSREAAGRAMTLVKNDAVDGSPVLPLDPAVVTSIALIGRLATVANTGDHGSSDVRTPHVVTAEEGLRAAFPGATITVVADDDPVAAARAAGAAEVAVVVAGYTADDEGEYVGQEMFTLPQLQALYPPAPEGVSTSLFFDDSGNIVGGTGAGGDRASLRLRPVDAEIIRAVAAANPRTVVAVVAAGAVITEEWRAQVPAILFSWYAGSEGGHALADVLTGAVDASGRLPFSVPTDEAHLPFFDRDATAITYDRWFGQRLLDRDGHAAAFPLGWGLSYSSFALSDLETGPADGEIIPVVITVTNTGTRAGRHVVQVYGSPLGADGFPARGLLGFAPVELGAGESATLRIAASTRPLQRWTGAGFVPASSRVRVEAAAFAGDPDALIAEVVL